MYNRLRRRSSKTAPHDVVLDPTETFDAAALTRVGTHDDAQHLNRWVEPLMTLADRIITSETLDPEAEDSLRFTIRAARHEMYGRSKFPVECTIVERLAIRLAKYVNAGEEGVTLNVINFMSNRFDFTDKDLALLPEFLDMIGEAVNADRIEAFVADGYAPEALASLAALLRADPRTALAQALGWMPSDDFAAIRQGLPVDPISVIAASSLREGIHARKMVSPLASLLGVLAATIRPTAGVQVSSSSL